MGHSLYAKHVVLHMKAEAGVDNVVRGLATKLIQNRLSKGDADPIFSHLPIPALGGGLRDLVRAGLCVVCYEQ